MTIQNAIGNVLRLGTQIILGSDATGDIYYRAANGLLARLGVGSANQYLGLASSGTGQPLLPVWVNGPSTFAWATVTATSQTAAVNTGYFINSSAQCALSLPSSSPVGSLIEVVGVAGGWKLTPSVSGQSINFGSIANGAQLTSTQQRDSIRLVCITQDTLWQVISSVGNIDVT